MERVFLQSQEAAVPKEEESLTRQAIPITKTKASITNAVPASGEDYLLHVRDQAKKCPQTVVAPPPKQIKQVSLPSHYLWMMSSSSSTPANTPDPQWQESFGQSFKQFQQSKQKNKPPPSPPLLPIGDKQGWHHICYSTEPVSVPLASVACMSQRIILRLLMYFKEWLTEMTEREGLWLFTLLVYLDPVITSGNLSLLRDLSRRCIALRSDQQEEDPSVPRLNVIITLIAKGFGQADLI